MPDLKNKPDEWEVENIVGDKRHKRQAYFLIKQKGWPAEYNQWVLQEDLSAPEILEKYHRAYATKKRKKRRSVN